MSSGRWTASIATTSWLTGFHPQPERAVDEAIAAGKISRTLPFVRREAVRLLKADYAEQDAGLRAIEEGLRTFYAPRGSAIDARNLDQAVDSLRAVYSRNVFPSMKVTWGVYPDNLGHMTSSGCFRCHDDSHTAKDGTTISADCEYCHKQIETPTPAPQTAPAKSSAAGGGWLTEVDAFRTSPRPRGRTWACPGPD